MADPRPRRLVFLDAIRGVAILAVYLFHSVATAFFYDRLPWGGIWRDFHLPGSFLVFLPLTFGWSGVAIFFAVSGFCIHLSHARSGEAGYGRFFVRRFFRIYPPYAFAAVLFFFVGPWSLFFQQAPDRGIQLASHLLLVQNFSARTFFSLNPSFWSIAVEAQLYLIYPLLLGLVARIGWSRALWLCLLFEVSLRLFSDAYGMITGSQPFHWLAYSPLAYWLSWSMGAWLAEKYLKSEALPFAAWPVLPWLAAALGVTFFRPTDSLSFLLFSLVTVIVIAKVLAGRVLVPDGVVFRHLRFAGIVSYSFYLLHQPLVASVPRALHSLFPGQAFHPVLVLAVCLLLWPVALGISRLAYSALELPSIRLGKRILGL